MLKKFPLSVDKYPLLLLNATVQLATQGFEALVTLYSKGAIGGDRGQGGQLISYQLSVIKLNWQLFTVNCSLIYAQQPVDENMIFLTRLHA
ncbi:hypothetical protein AMR41_22470 [Hapalosiphon sp. MRB220]|nr:hypothetical protein AMR41_22470 [Hapalosiphon sp. MRB220]